MTREQWLGAGVVALRPKFVSVGCALPETVHASIGFPSRGALSRRTRVVGQCWSRETSKDGNCQIFISPVLITPIEILDTLAHELVHVVTPGAKHRGKFITISRAVGLTEGKPTSAAAGAELKVVLEEIAHQLGSLPLPRCPSCDLDVSDHEPGKSSEMRDGLLWHPDCLREFEAGDIMVRLRKSVDATCPANHQHETIVDSRSTDSDTEILTLHCPDCGRTREDEVLGSTIRAEEATA